LLRYSEVLLLAAEAYNKATPNLDAQARIELNKVRKSWLGRCHQHLVGQLYLMPLLTKVLELAFEGQRFGI
jgi:hypothetical protein